MTVAVLLMQFGTVYTAQEKSLMNADEYGYHQILDRETEDEEYFVCNLEHYSNSTEDIPQECRDKIVSFFDTNSKATYIREYELFLFEEIVCDPLCGPSYLNYQLTNCPPEQVEQSVLSCGVVNGSTPCYIFNTLPWSFVYSITSCYTTTANECSTECADELMKIMVVALITCIMVQY